MYMGVSCIKQYDQGVLFGRRFHARKRRVKPLRASQSLPETFPGTGYKAFYLKITTMRGNRIACIGIRVP